MTLSINFPKAPDVPGDVPLLMAARPGWTGRAAADLLGRFEIRGEARDLGPWLVGRDDRAAVELYQNSHSFRYERLDVDGEGRKGTADGVDEAEAVRLATEMLGRFPISTGRLGAPVVSDHEVLVSERAGTEPRRILVGRQVSFRIDAGDATVFGPGAKAQVTIGAGGQMTGMYRFWREVRPGKPVKTVAPERAFERFAASELLAGLDDGRARCEITSIRFGYLSKPPTEAQGSLLPAYELEGVLSTEALPRYEFTSYVLAAELEPADAKWAARVGSISDRLA